MLFLFLSLIQSLGERKQKIPQSFVSMITSPGFKSFVERIIVKTAKHDSANMAKEHHFTVDEWDENGAYGVSSNFTSPAKYHQLYAFDTSDESKDENGAEGIPSGISAPSKVDLTGQPDVFVLIANKYLDKEKGKGPQGAEYGGEGGSSGLDYFHDEKIDPKGCNSNGMKTESDENGSKGSSSSSAFEYVHDDFIGGKKYYTNTITVMDEEEEESIQVTADSKLPWEENSNKNSKELNKVAKDILKVLSSEEIKKLIQSMNEKMRGIKINKKLGEFFTSDKLKQIAKLYALTLEEEKENVSNYRFTFPFPKPTPKPTVAKFW